MKAIETFYRGYRFRSRLEARWAVFLDCCGIKWQYEPEGYDLGDAGCYLPDFWLPLPLEYQQYPSSGYWLEIKGQMPTQDELDKLASLTHQTKHSGWLVVGQPGQHKRFIAHHTGNSGWMDFSIHPHLPNDFDAYNMVAHLPNTSMNYDMDDMINTAILTARQVRFEHNDNLLRHLESNI